MAAVNSVGGANNPLVNNVAAKKTDNAKSVDNKKAEQRSEARRSEEKRRGQREERARESSKKNRTSDEAQLVKENAAKQTKVGQNVDKVV